MVRLKSKDLNNMGIVIDGTTGKASIMSKGAMVVEDENTGLDILNRRIFIPGEVRSSKNSKQVFMKNKNDKNGNLKKIPSVTNSEATKKYKSDTCWHYKLFASSFRNLLKDRHTPYIIEFQFVRGKHDKWDFANMVQLPQDMMVEWGWLEDDNVRVMLPVPNIENPFLIDPKRPGVWIKVI